jgi:hypothetical protein
VLVGGGGDGARACLLKNGRWVVAAHGAVNELAEDCALVLKAGVDRLLRDARLVCDRGDARALIAALREQPGGRVEYPLARLLGLLAPALGAVAASLDIPRHHCHSTTVSNTAVLYRREWSWRKAHKRWSDG